MALDLAAAYDDLNPDASARTAGHAGIRVPRSNREVLAFRDAASLVRSLEEAGFAVTHRYDGWQRTPLTPDAAEIILVAPRR